MIGTTLALAVRARKLPSMGRAVLLLALAALFAGCDVAGNAATATAGAESAVQQASQTQRIEDRVRGQIGAAYQQAADQRQAQEMDGR
jgi:hypothetical protein